MSHSSYRYRYGMNWIRQEKRLAIYMRDHFQCVYCRACLEDEIILTLDHVKHTGGNEATNLVTACWDCNVSKGRRSVERFLEELTEGDGKKAERIMRRVARATEIRLTLLLPQAKVVRAARKREEPF